MNLGCEYSICKYDSRKTYFILLWNKSNNNNNDDDDDDNNNKNLMKRMHIAVIKQIMPSTIRAHAIIF